MASGITFSLGSSKTVSTQARDRGSSPTTQKNGTKRSHASLDDDSDDEATPAKQSVTHFDSKGAYNSQKPIKEQAPLVIKAQKNRDWRDSSKAAQAQRRAKYGLPSKDSEDQAKSREEELKRLENANKPTFGLNVKSHAPSTEESAETVVTRANINGANSNNTKGESPPRKPRTDDERALDALLGIKQQSDLTIPAATEEEAFQQDFRNAPPMATLEQYAATPVEEFGAALLRGMGWKEGYGIGTQKGEKSKAAKVLERRPALLGIGAKEDAAVKEEMGAWGRGTRGGKPAQVYNPVVMRNKKTGEEVTEEELQTKKEEQSIRADRYALEDKRKAGDWDQVKSEGRRRRDELSDEEYERRRRDKRKEEVRRERDGDRTDDRPRSRDRDDRRDRDRHGERRDRDSDRDRARNRDRDRDRERYRDGYRDECRDRDHRERHHHTDHRDKDRDRDKNGESHHDRRRRR